MLSLFSESLIKLMYELSDRNKFIVKHNVVIILCWAFFTAF